MKRKIYALFLSALCCGMVQAQEPAVMELSHCGGEVATTGNIGQAGEQYVSAATYFTADEVGRFAGNEIVAVRAGLASKLNVDELTVWIRASLDGENLAECTVTDGIVKGWNELTFETAYDITEEAGLYVGYSFHQKGACYAVSAVGGQMDDGCWVKFGDNDWADYSEEGMLSVEALVSGENLPEYDLALLSVSAKESYPLNTEMPVQLIVRNLASCDITGFDVTCEIDGAEPYTTHIDTQMAYNEADTVDFSFVPDLHETAEGKVMTVTIGKLDDGEDENMDDNVLSFTFDVIAHEYVRNVIVEEFTTEQCPNCPLSTKNFAAALESDPIFAERVFAICHHSGYYTDWLTTPADRSYEWFFNDGGATYAPAFMFDRYTYADNTPVLLPRSIDEMVEKMRDRMATPSYVGFDVEAGYDSAAKVLKIKVTGDRSREFCDTPARITVVVVENDLEAHGQAGTTSGEEYIHNHVQRACNATWGEVIEWDGDAFEYGCNITVKDSWAEENLEIIAFVSGYDSTDATNCVIENAARIKFAEVKGVDSVAGDGGADFYVCDGKVYVLQGYEPEVYSLNGFRVENERLDKGIYIVKVKTEEGIQTGKVVVR